MSREIKFKAWCKGKGWIQGFNMVNFHHYYNKGIEPNIYRYSTEWKLSEIELCQYTGLQDRNGKDIYEGDIVKWGHFKDSKEDEIRIAEVKINPDIQFDCKNIKYPHIFHWGRFAYGGNQLEVIGNIYNNPELLNTNT